MDVGGRATQDAKAEELFLTVEQSDTGPEGVRHREVPNSPLGDAK